jgi:hypothetical protein
VPKDCFATYRYEIYLRTLDTSETGSQAERFLLAIVFRELAASATRQQWQKVLEAQASQSPATGADSETPPSPSASASQQPPATTGSTEPPAVSPPSKNDNAASIFRWLPTVDSQRLEQAKSAALASLRVGPAAEQRLACYR